MALFANEIRLEDAHPPQPQHHHRLPQTQTRTSTFFSRLKNFLTPTSCPSLQWRSLFTFKTLTGYPPPDSSRQTAWLDGLRGTAAFLVLTYHYGLDMHWPTTYEAPYASRMLKSDSDNNGIIVPFGPAFNALWRLPLVRNWMDSGHAQVSVFFVLSGFVLSWGPLGRKGELRALGSATLRRWMRLYLPCFGVAFLGCVEMYLGLYGNFTTRKETFWGQVWDYLKGNVEFADPLRLQRDEWGYLHPYNYTMWTIPHEFEGSLLVFLLVLAVCKLRAVAKMAIVLAVAAWSCYKARWTYWLFASGLLLAIYVRAMGGFQKLDARQSRLSLTLWSLAFLASFLLLGTPERSSENIYTRPGWEWMDIMIPSNWLEIEAGTRFWWSWAGIIFVTSACHLSTIRNLYARRLPRYLGRVSFMLYLTHREVGLELIGKPLQRKLYDAFGRGRYVDELPDGKPANPWTTPVIYWIWMGIMVPIVVVMAHWFTCVIDEPSVRFAKSVEGLMTMKQSRVEGDVEGRDYDDDNEMVLPLHGQENVSLGRQEVGTVDVLHDKDEEDEMREDAALLQSDLEMTEIPLDYESVRR